MVLFMLIELNFLSRNELSLAENINNRGVTAPLSLPTFYFILCIKVRLIAA